MELKIRIEMDNAAFEDEPSVEVSRILRKIIKEIDGLSLSVGTYIPLMDANGNKVGTAEVAE